MDRGERRDGGREKSQMAGGADIVCSGVCDVCVMSVCVCVCVCVCYLPICLCV